jgi:hypothetical protein
MLNRVALRHDEFIIERKRKSLAALVRVETARADAALRPPACRGHARAS